MKRLLLIVLAACALASAAFLRPGASAQESPDHVKWVLKSLGEMNKVKVGMTRADLLKVFEEEGGLSTRTQRTYVYRQCSYFKVDVKFKAVGGVGERHAESPEDRIVEMSKPYIAYSILD